MKIFAKFEKYASKEGRLKFAESLINLGLVFIGSAMLGLFQLLARAFEIQQWWQVVTLSIALRLGLKLRDEGLMIYDQQHEARQV